MVRFLVCLLIPVYLNSQVIPLEQARSLPTGTLVTVRGIVTNGAELGTIRYMQDETAGIALYPGSGSQSGFADNVNRGDSILASGYLTSYNGLLEISPVLSYEILAGNRPLPSPKTISLNQLSNNLESQLVRIACLSFVKSGGVFSGAATFDLSDATGTTSRIYLANNHPLVGQTIPNEPVRITGILSRFGSFQLLPRSAEDFDTAPCFYLVQQPVQSEIERNSFRLSWESNLPAAAWLRYGPDPTSLNQYLTVPAAFPVQTVGINNLEPGTIYWAQAVAIANQDTIYSQVLPFATRSNSSGQIKVYFNQGYDAAAAAGLSPAGDNYEAVRNELLARINAAEASIDAAIYNNNRSDLTFALSQAKNRGVQVRYIAAESTANDALMPPPVFPVLYGNSSALMHNKFLVIDADLPDKAWVMSGSMNWTNGNMVQDYNNTLFVQDQSLARAYELEFEEMWGGGAAAPEPAKSRFGNSKTDNTPHRFIIGDRPVECYFSPSDQVTQIITSVIKQVDYQASFAIFSFTKDEIGNALANQHNKGAWVRGIIENTNDVGAEYPWLLDNGVPVKDHPASSALHHKYLVADAGYPGFDPVVITGSHNWTQAAESSNDENTLVIHDAALATLYQAEFEKRWQETGTATFELADLVFIRYPNPVTDRLCIRNNTEIPWTGTVEIRNVAGRLVGTYRHTGAVAAIPMGTLPQGIYLISIITEHDTATFPIQALSR